MPVIGTKKMKVKVGGTDYTAQVLSAHYGSAKADSNFMTFAQAEAGGAKRWYLKMKVVQNTDSSSLWYYLNTSLGSSVPVELWPNGYNSTAPSTPTALYPKLTATATVSLPDGMYLGAEAEDSTTAVSTVEVEWDLTGAPVTVTA